MTFVVRILTKRGIAQKRSIKTQKDIIIVLFLTDVNLLPTEPKGEVKSE